MVSWSMVGSPIEAKLLLQEAFEDYLAAMLGWGNEIPEPRAWPGEVITEEQIRAARAFVSSAQVQGEALPHQRIPETRLVEQPEYELA